MNPSIISATVSAAKALWGIYKDVEAKNHGHSPAQLKARLDSLDDVVQKNFQIIEKLSAHIEAQRKLLMGSYLLSAILMVFMLLIAVK